MFLMQISWQQVQLFFKLDLLKSYLAEKTRLKFSFNSTDLALLILALFCSCIVAIHFNMQWSVAKSLKVIGVGFAIIGIKLFSEYLIGHMIGFSRTAKLIVFSKLMSLIYTSIIFFLIYTFIVLNVEISEILLFILIGTLALLNLIIIGIQVNKNRSDISSHWFYFILYICSLEIAPIIIGLNWYRL